MTNMRNISVQLPDKHIITLALLVRREDIPSRSEGVREAIQQYLERLEKNKTNMEEFIQRELSQ